MLLHEKKLTKITKENKIKIKIVCLEELTSSPKAVSKDLFEYLGFEWNENRLDSLNKKKKIIKTLSGTQVRKKNN